MKKQKYKKTDSTYEILELLVKYGADVQDFDCVRMSIIKKHWARVKFLIENGFKYDFDWIDLHCPELIKAFLYHGNIDLWYKNRNKHNVMAAIIVFYENSLLTCGLIDVIYQFLMNKYKNNIEEIDKYINDNSNGEDGDTLLHLAMKDDYDLVVKYLLSIKVELNTKNGKGTYNYIMFCFLKFKFEVKFQIKQKNKKNLHHYKLGNQTQKAGNC